MNPEILKKMLALANKPALKPKLPRASWCCSVTASTTEAPVAVIRLDQPQHEAIFAILHEIGNFKLHSKGPRPATYALVYQSSV